MQDNTNDASASNQPSAGQVQATLDTNVQGPRPLVSKNKKKNTRSFYQKKKSRKKKTYPVSTEEEKKEAPSSKSTQSQSKNMGHLVKVDQNPTHPFFPATRAYPLGSDQFHEFNLAQTVPDFVLIHPNYRFIHELIQPIGNFLELQSVQFDFDAKIKDQVKRATALAMAAQVYST